MKDYNQLFENNKLWIKTMLKKDPHFFEKLAKDQNPDFLYIGCSDSRVPANEIMGLEPRDVFVHRNIANIIDNIDVNANSVIEFAVEQLQVKHIIVCGHYDCGGVQAAMQARDLGIMNGWLRSIRDVYRLHKTELNLIKSEKDRFDRLVELNVHEQSVNVIKSKAVQMSYQRTGYPIVHGWVFSLHNGKLIDLKIDFEGILNDIKEIYGLESPKDIDQKKNNSS